MNIELRVLRIPENESALLRVLEAAPSYWLRISGKTPGSDAARETFETLPPGKSQVDKFVFGIFERGEIIGCVDLVRGFPDAGTAMLGLLLVGESHHGRGIGRAAYEQIELIARGWSARKIRIGVMGTNAGVLPFWKSLGFVETGVRREAIVLEKNL